MQTDKKHLFARLALLLIAALFSFQFGSRADSGANVSITSVPPWGQAGSIQGNVTGAAPGSAQLPGFFFIPAAGWDSVCSPVPIQSTGAFFLDLRSGISSAYATRVRPYVS